MNSIALLLRLDGEPVGNAIVTEARRLMGHGAKDGLSIVATGPVVAMYAKSAADRAAEADPGIRVDPATGIVAVAAARFDNREAIDRVLGGPSGDRTDTDRALELYLRLGATWPSAVIGDFSVALWDPRCNELHIARDHVGVKPLYHTVAGPLVGVASDVRTLSAVPGAFDVIDRFRVADLVTGSGTSRHRTVYDAVRRLPGGHRGVFVDRRWTFDRYWEPIITPIERAPVDEVVGRIRELVDDAVRCRMGTDRPVVAELSGGLDSSSVAGVAARLIRSEPMLAASLACGSLVYPGLACDESERIAITVDHLGLTARSFDASQVYADPDLLVRQARFTGEPGSYILGPANTEFQRWLADSGARIVLSGVGGDQLFWGPSTYLADLARVGRFFTIARHLRAYGAGRPSNTWWAVKHRLLGPLIPPQALPAGRWLLGRRPPEQFAWLTAAARADLLAGRRREVESLWPGLPRGSQAGHLLGEIADPHLAWQLEVANRSSTTAGCETRYPFLDVRLVEYMARLPVDLPTVGGRFRGLQRAVFDGDLAPAVRDYRAKAEFSAIIQRATTGYAGEQFSLPRLAALGFVNESTFQHLEADNRRLVSDGLPIRLAHAVGTALAVERWVVSRDVDVALSDQCPTVG